MANKIFDRDTLLDLTVNVVPLFIMAFFVVAFAVIAPFGIDPLASAVQFGLLAVPFVLLAILTYFAGRAVAGSEQSGDVYLPGQAGVRGAEPLEEEGHELSAIDPEPADDAPAVDGDSDAESDAESDADAEGDSTDDAVEEETDGTDDAADDSDANADDKDA